MFTVTIISPARSMEPINKVIEENDFPCRFHKYIYQHLTDIDAIYEECKDKCDVLFFSGELGYHYIHRRFPDIQLPCAFTSYGTRDVLSILLRFVIEHPTIPLNRMYIDFLTPYNHFMSLPSYLPPEHTPYFFEEQNYDYEHITRRGLQLWNEGKIDIILSRSINYLSRFEALGIPYLAVFPSEEMIRSSIEIALKDLQLNRIANREHLSISIRLPFESNCGQYEQEYRMATLYKLLVDYRRDHAADLSIRQGFNQFDLLMPVNTGEWPLKNSRDFVLWLRQELSMPFRVGIGLHEQEEQSRFYAAKALLEAVRFGRNDGFCITGSNGSLTGPLAAEQGLTYRLQNQKASDFARSNGIGENNLFKLLALFQAAPTTPLTALSVSEALAITPRSANRILQKLVSLGLVCTVAAPQPSGKGRPVHCYQFVEEAFRAALL